MPYRSDLDALEARYDALNSEVQDRTRERDEVAVMVAEARARHDQALYERNRRQRRRDRHVALSVIATTTIVVAGIVAAGLANSHAHERHHERALEVFSGFVDRTCACTTRACADAVNDEMTKWAVDAAGTSAQEMPPPALLKKFEEQATRYGNCMSKLTVDPLP